MTLFATSYAFGREHSVGPCMGIPETGTLSRDRRLRGAVLGLEIGGPGEWVEEELLSQGGDFDDLYPDVCVEGLENDPF